MIRSVFLQLLPTPSNVSTSVLNTGLGPGEAWARITVIRGELYPLNSLQELINSTLGTQLRFYNVCIEGHNAVLYAKIRQKQVSRACFVCIAHCHFVFCVHG